MNHFATAMRSRGCGNLGEPDVGQEVDLTGWVHRRRDLGGLIFIELRDRTGIVQIVFDPNAAAAHQAAAELRLEYVAAIRGTVCLRPADKVNPLLATGTVEVAVTSLHILNAAKTPPFPIQDQTGVSEDLRLKYRYMDLRRPLMQNNLVLRHRVTKAVRDYFDEHGFLEIETPVLTRSTPEGARDYLVPSRVSPGSFYALPQSPQLFKQLLMVSGLDRYVQIVRCFRDEDLRADRQPEFTQIDVEMSFVERGDVLAIAEGLVARVLAVCADITVPTPFPRLTYAEAMDRYGSDKPDLRFGLELIDVSDIVAGSNFAVFAGAVAGGGVVKAIRGPGLGGLSRKEIGELEALAKTFQARGLAWLALPPETDGPRSSFAKFLTPDESRALIERSGLVKGDLLMLVADEARVANTALGQLRLELARRLDLIPAGSYNFLWVVDFPLLEYDADARRWSAVHHPFTAPHPADVERVLAGNLTPAEVGQLRANAYDLVLNGVELGGGSVRIHRRDLQECMFSMLGLSADEAQAQFGFLLDAFDYGTPPHAGIAFGLDRWLMLMAGAASIRDVIAFPKTAKAADLMVGAPAPVTRAQLAELGLQTKV